MVITMPVTFLHTADWHIDKSFDTSFDTHFAEVLKKQRLKTIQSIASLAKERNVDAVLVAGDIFHNVNVSDSTLRRFLNNLEEFNGTWLLLPGNHDPLDEEGLWNKLKKLSPPENVILLTGVKPWYAKDKSFVILPAPLSRQSSIDLKTTFDVATPPNIVRIGLGHCAIAGWPHLSSPYTPMISRNDIETAQLTYLALGHYHRKRKCISDSCWYAGTPEPMSFDHEEQGYVLLVKIDTADTTPHVESIPISHYRWIKKDYHLLPSDDLTLLENQLQSDKPYERILMKLTMSGHVNVTLDTHIKLKKMREEWEARLAQLIFDHDSLSLEPDEQDWEVLMNERSTLISQTAQKLKQQLESTSSDPVIRPVIRDALSLLYDFYQRSNR